MSYYNLISLSEFLELSKGSPIFLSITATTEKSPETRGVFVHYLFVTLTGGGVEGLQPLAWQARYELGTTDRKELDEPTRMNFISTRQAFNRLFADLRDNGHNFLKGHVSPNLEPIGVYDLPTTLLVPTSDDDPETDGEDTGNEDHEAEPAVAEENEAAPSDRR